GSGALAARLRPEAPGEGGPAAREGGQDRPSPEGQGRPGAAATDRGPVEAAGQGPGAVLERRQAGGRDEVRGRPQASVGRDQQLTRPGEVRRAVRKGGREPRGGTERGSGSSGGRHPRLAS